MDTQTLAELDRRHYPSLQDGKCNAGCGAYPCTIRLLVDVVIKLLMQGRRYRY
jgi:hypothetical protein